jgi:hypothetical protein
LHGSNTTSLQLPTLANFSNCTPAALTKLIDCLPTHSCVPLIAEGYEYPMLGSLQPEDALPSQLVMEMHMIAGHKIWPNTNIEAAMAVMHLAELGYASYSYEPNPLNPAACAEISFKRLV